jgi:predicted esterase
MVSGPHADAQIYEAGTPLRSASGVLLLLHGRGASAADILGLGEEIAPERVALVAPQAAGNTWYPNSFLAPVAQNEPWLSSALELVESIVRRCLDAGVGVDRIAICGFSQGACLSTEFVARYSRRYAALIAFTGGLIGPLGIDLHHAGSGQNVLGGTPVLFSSGDPDPHVPWVRVEDSARELEAMGAKVEVRRYPLRPHTVLREEAENARGVLAQAFSTTGS